MEILKILYLSLLIFSATPTIVETPIIAQTTHESKIHSDKDLNFPIGEIPANIPVEILQDYSAESYKIYEPFSKQQGWIDGAALSIPPEAPTDKTILTVNFLENFVNKNNCASDTDYLILTDINRQKTHVFKGSRADWAWVTTFDCSTGLNTSPTTRGTFTITDRGDWFYSERLASGAKYWMRFNEQYLFHSIPMDKNKRL